MVKYVEIYVPVWKPDEESAPFNLTLDIDMKENKLDNIDSELKEVLSHYNNVKSISDNNQSVVLRNLRDLLEEGLIRDASCDVVGIRTVDELKTSLNSGEIEECPLR